MQSFYACGRSPVTHQAIARCFCSSPAFRESGRRQLQVRAMASQQADTFKLLQYEYTPNILELRGPYREGHLAAAKAMQDQGKLVMAGAFGDPVSGGLFIFKNTSEEEIEQYAKSDPYQQNGLITGWKIMPYAVAIGN